MFRLNAPSFELMPVSWREESILNDAEFASLQSKWVNRLETFIQDHSITDRISIVATNAFPLIEREVPRLQLGQAIHKVMDLVPHIQYLELICAPWTSSEGEELISILKNSPIRSLQFKTVIPHSIFTKFLEELKKTQVLEVNFFLNQVKDVKQVIDGLKKTKILFNPIDMLSICSLHIAFQDGLSQTLKEGAKIFEQKHHYLNALSNIIDKYTQIINNETHSSLSLEQQLNQENDEIRLLRQFKKIQDRTAMVDHFILKNPQEYEKIQRIKYAAQEHILHILGITKSGSLNGENVDCLREIFKYIKLSDINFK